MIFLSQKSMRTSESITNNPNKENEGEIKNTSDKHIVKEKS